MGMPHFKRKTKSPRSVSCIATDPLNRTMKGTRFSDVSTQPTSLPSNVHKVAVRAIPGIQENKMLVCLFSPIYWARPLICFVVRQGDDSGPVTASFVSDWPGRGDLNCMAH